MRSVFQAKTVAVAQAAIHLRTQAEVFTAKCAGIGAGKQRKRPAGRNRISELPGLGGQVLLRDDVFGDVPTSDIAGEDQLQLRFAFPFTAIIALKKVADAVVS